MRRIVSLCLELTLLCALPAQAAAEQLPGFIRLYALLPVELLGAPGLVREDTPMEYSFVNIDMDESTVALLGRYSGKKPVWPSG